MSDTVQTRRLPPRERPDVTLPNGTVLTPRAKFADQVGVCDKTVARMNLPSRRIGGVAYVDRDASLEIIGADVRPQLQPRATDRDAKVA
jgi:hypothetical protein